MLCAFMLTAFRARLACLAAAVACFTLVGCERVPLLAPAGSTLTLTSSASTLPISGSTTLIAQVCKQRVRASIRNARHVYDDARNDPAA
jgi:hypothetical protein